MTFAPPTLLDLGAYLVAHGVVNLGIVGDTAHAARGWSYHLGADQLIPDAYSNRTARDRAGLSNAASAIDLGRVDGSLAGLRTLSVRMVNLARTNAPGTSDWREIIYTPDGVDVWRWDRERGFASLPATGPGQGDDSHLTHTHLSFYRDAEARAKLAPFRALLEVDMDPALDVPVGRVNVAPCTVYSEPRRATAAVLILNWSGAANVQAYSERPGWFAIRIDPPGSGTANIAVGWVGADVVTPVTAPAPDCSAPIAQAIAADRAMARIVYGGG